MLAWWESLKLTQQILACFAIPSTVILFLQTILLCFSAFGGGAGHEAGPDTSGLDSDNDLDVAGPDLDASADSDLDVAGPDLDVAGDSDLDVAGPDLDVSGDSDLDVSADADTPDGPELDASSGHDVHMGHGHSFSEAGAHHSLQTHYTEPGTDNHAEGTPEPGLRLFTLRGIIAFFSLFGWTGILFIELDIPTVISIGLGLLAGFLAMLLIAYVMMWFMKLTQTGNADVRTAVGTTGEVYLTVPAAGKGSGKVTVMVSGRLTEYDAVTNEDQPIPTGEKAAVIGIVGNSTLIVKKAD